MENEKYTLITGARSGLGKEIAIYCGKLGMNLLLVSLPGKDLKDVAGVISKEFNVKVNFLEIDLSKVDAPVEILNWVKNNNYRVNILINNAARGGTIQFEVSDLMYNDYRIQLNIRTLIVLINLFLPILKENDKAYILNVSSLSAFFSIPYKSLYSSTKAFVVHFSRALRYELRNTTVSVSVVCPNGIRTNVNSIARINTHGRIGRFVSLDPEKIAKLSVDGMLKGKLIIIPGFSSKILLVLKNFLPSSLLQKILWKEFRKEIQDN